VYASPWASFEWLRGACFLPQGAGQQQQTEQHRILLRIQQGMAFHFWAITFFVSPKILIFFGWKNRILFSSLAFFIITNVKA